MRLRRWLSILAVCAVSAPLLADDNPPPSQPANSVNPPFVGAGLNEPFPDAYYGADHNGSSISLDYAFTSPFGNTDHSRGVIVYACAPFTPRGSEGVYGMDVWLEQEDASGNWSPASLNGGVPDQGYTYQPVNTPNPGPSPAYTFTWTFDETQLPPYTNFRIFVYVYLYNQGGSSQGNFYVASSLGSVSTGAADDPPRISWAASFGAVNPSQVQAGSSYTISANAQDDNGDLIAVDIDKNGQPFAYAGGGDGFSGNSQNPASDPAGTEVYTAWASDSRAGQSPTISWTVSVAGQSAQPPVGSANASIEFGQAFAPSVFGGAGTGGWQFAVGGYTNWDGGTSSETGTWLPSGPWTPTWTPPAVGSYSFWVVRDGDADYNPSNAAGPYTLTVTAAPASFSAAPTLFTYDGASQGPLVSPFPAGATFQVTGTSSAVNAGSYSFTTTATGNYTGASAVFWTISQAAQPAVSISPPISTISTGQSVTFTASGGAGTGAYLWSGSASGSGPTSTVVFDSPGTFTVTATRAGDTNYAASNPASATVSVDTPPPPPTATLSASPSTGAAPLATTLTWITSQASTVTVSGSGLSSAALSGSQTVTLSSAGSYTYTLTATGPGGEATQSATVTVSAPLYTLTTEAIGNGSVTPGGSYPANSVVTISATPGPGAYFGGWTGSLASGANPLTVTMTGNLTLDANFSSMLAQTIAFSPPASSAYPGPPISLTATSSSGLPVSFTVLGGPGLLSGNLLSLTGTGEVLIQATQAGNSLWLPAAPVDGAIAVGVVPPIARIRFNATGLDARGGPSAPSPGGSFLWTDPSGVTVSPWPSFSAPVTAIPIVGNISLPAVPGAPPGTP